MDQMILHPGEYFIELEFDRPVDPAVLHRALTGMGFGVVVFDQSIPSVEVGGTRASISAAVTALKPSTTATVAPIQSRYVAAAPVIAVVAAPKAVASVAPIVAVVAKPPAAVSQYASSAPAVRLADGGSPTALKPSATVAAVAAIAAKSPATTVSPIATKPGVTPTATSPSVPTQTGPATPAAPPPPAAEPVFPGDVPAPAAQPYGGGGESAPVEKAAFVAPPPVYEEAEPAPPPPPLPEAPPPPPPPQQAAAPSPQPLAPSGSAPERDPRKLTELWTKWKEWGSPFASGPNVSGVGAGADELLHFRVLARLDRPIALDDRPGMRWLFVKALSIPFLSDLVFQANPHTLRQGALYELRFLSRAKSNRTRDSVKQELVDMGWKPVKLSAIKRNMTLPRRPASLTLWYGMAVWNHADSVIVNDDPFFFETVKEIRPQ